MEKIYYKKNIIEDINPELIKSPFFDEWFEIVKEILISDEFQKRKLFKHHHKMSVWDHTILVSYNSFIYAGYFNADKRICAIAGLLHDFYPDAWLYSEELAKIDDGKYVKHLNEKVPFFKAHGFIHGSEAAKNYIKYFPNLENVKITNSIKNHMFPLTPPPRYKEGWIITSVDKLNSVKELPSVYSIPKYLKKAVISIKKSVTHKN